MSLIALFGFEVRCVVSKLVISEKFYGNFIGDGVRAQGTGEKTHELEESLGKGFNFNGNRVARRSAWKN